MSTPFIIPLSPATAQKFTVTLNTVIYTMRLMWCGPSQCWMLNIADEFGDGIANGLPMLPGQDLVSQLEYLGFTGPLKVQCDSDNEKVPNFYEIGDDGKFYFISPV